MGRIEEEEWMGKEVERVYIAARTREAERVEQVLAEHGIDYLVEPEPYVHPVLGIFPITYTGIGFCVLPLQVKRARAVLLEAGLSAGIEPEGG